MTGPAQIEAIAQGVRTGLVVDAPARGRDPVTLSGDCLEASCRLRDALEAVRIRAFVRAGRFRVDAPDPRTCMCKGSIAGHHELCFLWPHAWVEVEDRIVDLTVSQFAAMMAPAERGRWEAPVVMHPLGAPDAARWIPDQPRATA